MSDIRSDSQANADVFISMFGRSSIDDVGHGSAIDTYNNRSSVVDRGVYSEQVGEVQPLRINETFLEYFGALNSNDAHVDRTAMLERALPVQIFDGVTMRELATAVYGGHYPLAAICELNKITPDVIPTDFGDQIIEPTFSKGRTYRLPCAADVEMLTDQFWKRIFCGCDDEKGYIEIPPMCNEKPKPTCPPPEK
ncbi:MAG: hypothetical protein JST89_08905, partial [Cyanobacteria bacterium SZAS-4]|nr:hypothetical protein [Cyanobacteria bacterium SZAS-4]